MEMRPEQLKGSPFPKTGSLQEKADWYRINASPDDLHVPPYRYSSPPAESALAEPDEFSDQTRGQFLLSGTV
jgi:hypothetical protein